MTPQKKPSDHKRAEIKRQETKITLESGLEISQSEQQTISDTPMTSSERNFTGNSDEANLRSTTLPKELKKNKSKLKRTPSSSSESSHGSANVEQRAALSRLVETLRVKPEHQTGSVIQYDAGLNNNRSADPSDCSSIIGPVHKTSLVLCKSITDTVSGHFRTHCSSIKKSVLSFDVIPGQHSQTDSEIMNFRVY